MSDKIIKQRAWMVEVMIPRSFGFVFIMYNFHFYHAVKLMDIFPCFYLKTKIKN